MTSRQDNTFILKLNTSLTLELYISLIFAANNYKKYKNEIWNFRTTQLNWRTWFLYFWNEGHE